MNKNILVLLAGTNNNIVRILPSLIIDEHETNLFLDIFNSITNNL